MSKSVLTPEQIVGLKPISKEDFAAALQESQEAIENGDVIPLDVAYAEFKERCRVRRAKIPNKTFQTR